MKDTLTEAVHPLGSVAEGSAARCRKLADEARVLAQHAANAEFRAGYLELMTQWNMLADEIERASFHDAVTKPPPRVLVS